MLATHCPLSKTPAILCQTPAKNKFKCIRSVDRMNSSESKCFIRHTLILLGFYQPVSFMFIYIVHWITFYNSVDPILHCSSVYSIKSVKLLESFQTSKSLGHMNLLVHKIPSVCPFLSAGTGRAPCSILNNIPLVPQDSKDHSSWWD